MATLRSLLFRILLFTLTPLLALALSPALLFGERGVRFMATIWTRMVLILLRLTCGIRHRIENPEHLPHGGALVASNHQSMWETIALFAVLPNAVFVLKKELTRIPVFGWLVGPAGNLIVDREGGATALRALTRAAADAVAAGRQVVIFPEGTRIKPGETAPFQPGVAGLYGSTGAACHPAGHNSGAYWRHPGGEKLPGVITLRFAPAIPPGLKRRDFMKTLESAIKHARPDLTQETNALSGPHHD